MEIKSIDYNDELILLVDDDEEIAIPFEKLLRHIGLETSHVGSAADALIELKRSKRYTFLITDIVMPEMDGLELTKRVTNEYPDVCIIVMTGYSAQYDYKDVVDAGATDFINKPFNIDELEAKIRRGIIERNTKDTLKELGITDALTGLYNQRHFFGRLNEEVIRTRRQKQPLSLILLDLDDFKLYNDKNGHLAGDAVLKNFGKIINSQIRQGVDSGYRYGGDEFAVILCNVRPDSCKLVGARIADKLKMKYGVSVSMGYALFSEEMTVKSFVKLADRNLYKFKGQKNALSPEQPRPQPDIFFAYKGKAEGTTST